MGAVRREDGAGGIEAGLGLRRFWITLLSMFHDECFGLGTQIFEVAVAGVEIVEVDDLDLDALDGPKFPDGWNGFVYDFGDAAEDRDEDPMHAVFRTFAGHGRAVFR